MKASWTTIDIDLDALAHNFQVVKKHAPHSKVLAMVKSNAYGHGLLTVANVLSHADALGVARLEEVKKLREGGVTKPIVLMPGFLNAKELSLLNAYDCDCVIHAAYQIDLLEDASLKKPIRIWLKVDTGMHRLGFSPDELEAAYKRIKDVSMLKDVIFMTHFSDADDLTALKTKQQLDVFEKACKPFGEEMSAANSAAILSDPESHLSWARPGIMLYGACPFLSKTAEDYHLKPAMTLRSTLIAVHHFHEGDTIGYGSTWECPEDMPVGVVGIGYGDGYPRHAKTGTPVLVGGKCCKLVGRVSMDMLTIDLRRYPDAKVGDQVILWGGDLPVEEVARHCDTISYELFCHLAPRLESIQEETQ